MSKNTMVVRDARKEGTMQTLPRVHSLGALLPFAISIQWIPRSLRRFITAPCWWLTAVREDEEGRGANLQLLQ